MLITNWLSQEDKTLLFYLTFAIIIVALGVVGLFLLYKD